MRWIVTDDSKALVYVSLGITASDIRAQELQYLILTVYIVHELIDIYGLIASKKVFKHGIEPVTGEFETTGSLAPSDELFPFQIEIFRITEFI